MSTFDRMELIEEIKAFAEELGMEKLTVLNRLADLSDNDLLKLWGSLKAICEVQG